MSSTRTRSTSKKRTSPKPTAAAGPLARSVRIRRWATVAAVAWVHITLLHVVPVPYSFSAAVALLAIPAAVTLWLRPASRPRWWRWVVVWWVFATAVPPHSILTLLFGETWLLHRVWYHEQTPTPVEDGQETHQGKPRRRRTRR